MHDVVYLSVEVAYLQEADIREHCERGRESTVKTGESCMARAGRVVLKLTTCVIVVRRPRLQVASVQSSTM